MKKIWNFLKLHLREDFNIKHYFTISVFLAACLSLNYTFRFEDDYLEWLTGMRKFLSYFIFYTTAYFFAVFSYCYYYNKRAILRQPIFWAKSVFAITILSLDSSVPFLHGWVNSLFHSDVQFWAYKVMINMISFFTVFTPILVFYTIYDRSKGHLYGLNARQFDTKPYFTMLLIMMPLIVMASFNDSFMRQYPMYKSSLAHIQLQVPEAITVAGYELAYGLDFITVEFFFRGFLVIGMMTILGRGAVLSMAVLYCFLHFGKPAGEAMSSVIGGFILGVVAYETRSIWGGVIVHVGIAWMMEVIAFLRKIFFLL
ncbi:MAG: CPBP family intramembrane glutamic endopeptidase [Bacteroidota bacterium]